MGNFFHMLFYGGGLKTNDTLCFSLYFFKILLVIFFPPLSVWIDQHKKHYKNPEKIAICFILTALFYFPGLLYAFKNISL